MNLYQLDRAREKRSAHRGPSVPIGRIRHCDIHVNQGLDLPLGHGGTGAYNSLVSRPAPACAGSQTFEEASSSLGDGQCEGARAERQWLSWTPWARPTLLLLLLPSRHQNWSALKGATAKVHL